MGLGPDLALFLIDVSEDGIGVRLKCPLATLDEVEVELLAPGFRKPVKRQGNVRWCRGLEDGTFLAGINLHKRLAYAEVDQIARS